MNGYDVTNTGVPGFLPVNYLEQTDLSDLLKKKNQAIQNQDLDALTNLYGAGNIGSEALLGLGSSGQGGWQTQRLGQQQITSNRKRVQDLVKLDPTNPLALLITLLGAGEERELRDDLSTLRGKDKKRQQQVAKVKAFEKSLKLGKNENAFASIVEREFKGDVVAAMNAPNIRELISQEKNRPVPLDWEDQHKLRVYVEEASNKLRLIEDGWDIAKPRQIAHLKSFIHMGNKLLDGSLQINSKDFGVMSAMGEGFSKGYAPDGSQIGVKSHLSEGVSGNTQLSSILANMAHKGLPPEKLENLKGAVERVRINKASKEDMAMVRAAAQQTARDILNTKPKVEVPELKDKVISEVEKAVSYAVDEVNRYYKTPDKGSAFRGYVAGDNFHYEGIDDEQTHVGYKNMLNGVEHNVMVNDDNGTYIAEYGGKLVVGRIKDWKPGYNLNISAYPTGERELEPPIKQFDLGDGLMQGAIKTPLAWKDALKYSNSLGETTILTPAEFDAINNSSSSPTPVNPMSKEELSQVEGYDASKDADLVGVSEAEKFKKYSTKLYHVESTKKEILVEKLELLEEKHQNNPKERAKVTALKNSIIEDKSSDDGSSFVFDTLEKIEKHPLAENPIISTVAKGAESGLRLVNELSVEDLQTLGMGNEKFEEKFGIPASDLPVIGVVGEVWRTAQDIANAPGLAGKGRVVASKAKKAWNFWFGDSPSKVKVLPNMVPEDGLVKPPEDYGDFDIAIVDVETGWRNKIGYKLKVKKGADGQAILNKDGKKILVYDYDSDGKKIPQSYGVAQLTVDTAFSTPFGKELLKSADIGRTKEERMKNKIKLLMVPSYNLKMSKQYRGILRKRFMNNPYSKNFSPSDMNLLVGTAYNYKGENMLKILNKTKPESFTHLQNKWRFPEQTNRHIENLIRKLNYGN